MSLTSASFWRPRQLLEPSEARSLDAATRWPTEPQQLSWFKSTGFKSTPHPLRPPPKSVCKLHSANDVAVRVPG